MEIEVGDTFGRLTVINKKETYGKSFKYTCKCTCGNERDFLRNALIRGNNKSCGCLSKSHEMAGSRIYVSWTNMKRRCNDPKNKSYNLYGGRGITYDERWGNFSNFYKDMKTGYSDNLTLDRIDVNKGYSKENCRWADKTTQANNTRSNRLLTYNNETLTMSQMAKKHGLTVNLLKGRLYKGWSVEDAIEKPIEKEMLIYKGESKTVSEWAKDKDMTYHQLKKRLMRGWTVEKALTQPIRKRIKN